MSFASLRDFIDHLEHTNQLKRVSYPVSTHLEITEIHKRVLHQKGPALLFEQVITPSGPSDIPILVNLFGTTDRVAAALGVSVEELGELGKLLAFLRQPTPPQGFKELKEMMPLAKHLLQMKPKIVKHAPCQEIILTGDDIDLASLPIQGCWPNEPAPLITWPIVVTKGPSLDATDNYNLGIYRMQLLSKNQTLMRWLKLRGGAQHHQAWSKKHPEPLPVAVVIGADPATTLAAVTPIPETLSEYAFAGLLAKKKRELVACKTIPLEVPAHAEIILEGHVSLTHYQDEGPYGDHTGYYNEVEPFPVFTVSAITMRKKPIYLSTYTGRPPDEPSILGEALNALFVPLFQQQFPEVVDFWLPPEACSYRMAVVSIKKNHAGHAKRIMMGVWSYLRQFTYTKFVIITDDDINVRAWDDVIWALSTRVDPKRDTTFIENSPIDYLDFASPVAGLGSKMGIDATHKWPGETERKWGEPLDMSTDIIDKVTKNWSKYGI